MTKAVPTRSDPRLAEWPVLVACASPGLGVAQLSELLNVPPNGPLNWENLLRLADEHGMLPLLNAKLAGCDQSLVPGEVQQKLREWHRTRTRFSLGLTAELFRVLERFGAADIGTLVTKGPALAHRCYGNPAMRQYDDLDLIVRHKDIKRATEVMIEDLRCEPRISLNAIAANEIPGEYLFRNSESRCLIEIHTEHTFRYHPRRLQVEKLFERGVHVEFDGREVPALSAEDELTLICIHGAKHFWARLMWIADVAALASLKKGVNPRGALASAREAGAERMLRIGLALVSAISGEKLHPDLAVDLESDPAVLQIVDKIRDRMPSTTSPSLSLFDRAAFRMKMRGGFLPGAAYLLRLSLSPTEEDWGAGSETKGQWLLHAMRRPFRLARKHSPLEKAD